MTNVFPFLNEKAARTSVNAADRPWDHVLCETENFVVVPTVGALIEGWLLIVTKQSYLCMGAIEEELHPELSALKDHVFTVLRQTYGDVAAFEHGPSQTGQQVGCGVDHAHLHVLPVAFPLTERVPIVTDVALDWQEVEGIHSAREMFGARTPYLYVEQPAGVGRITNASDAPSQLFRRVIADAIGSPKAFDWRNNPMEANVISTVNTLRWRFSRKEQLTEVGLVSS